MKISIIVPCYNEELALHYFQQEMDYISEEKMNYVEFEIIYINDGSQDKTMDVISQLAKKDKRIKYISFSRNFGKEAAMFAGLKKSSGDYVVIMDADLQHPPVLLRIYKTR